MKQERTDKMRLDHIATLLEEVRTLQESVLSTVLRVTEKLSTESVPPAKQAEVGQASKGAVQ
jgi:hypothetical protein